MDDKLLEQIDQLLSPFFATLGNKIGDIKTEVKIPEVKVNVPPVIIPKIELPKITIPEIKVPDINIPPIHVPKPEVTVNVDKVKIQNWPEPQIPERFDDTEILKSLKALLQKPTGGGGGPTEYASGGGYTANQLFGNVPLWDDAGTLQAISATKPLPVDIASGDIVDISTLATSAKQLADNHQVTVSNIASTPVITGFATSAKQDTLLTELQLKADLTETQPVSVAGNNLAGTGVAGTLALASANTWYACPTTVPAVPYVLVVSLENAAGTIRWAFKNTSAPSVTYGNLAPGHLTLRLAANEFIYYGSSTAGDDCNWTTKNVT